MGVKNIAINKRFMDSKQLHLISQKKHHVTNSQKAADFITTEVGSWLFLCTLIGLILVWVVLNTFILINSDNLFDPYPFIFLNLVLAILTVLQAPIILMSQNRAEERDRVRSEYDYLVDRKAEKEIELIQADLRKIKSALKIK